MGRASLNQLYKNNEWVDNDDSFSSPLGDVAIVGISIKLPSADTIDELWDVLINGIQTKHELPEHRKNDCHYCTELLGKPDTDYHFFEGSFLPEIDQFDAAFFKNSPKEAEYMSIIQRMLLQGAISAVCDAGYPISQIRSSATSVYVGYIGDGDGGQYMNMMKEILPSNRKALAVAGNLSSIIAGRIAYFLDLHGPAYSIDTACSSSLVALHTAVRAIRSGECEQALVCSARALAFPLKPDYELGMESKDGSTRTFDDQATGTGIGEGMVSLFIKSLQKAKTDRDSIYAVICGSAVNHNGATLGITAPNSDAQKSVLINAWQDANIHPQKLNYIEAHGTGTRIGDPIEITGIERAIQQYTAQKQFCPVGSIKSNIGHLYEAAGLVSLIKAIACIKHGVVPPTILFDTPNRMINFIESPVYIADRPVSLPAVDCVIGISSFGFSGTNCHLVVRGDRKIEKLCDEMPELLDFPFSKKTEHLLIAELTLFLSWIQSPGATEFSLQDIAYTLTNGRDHYACGITVQASTKSELIEELKRLKECICCGSVNMVDHTQELFDISSFSGSTRAHIPSRLFENRRYWFTDSISKSYDQYLNALCLVDYDIKSTKLYPSSHLLIISDEKTFSSFSLKFLDSKCTWFNYHDVALQKIMDDINSQNDVVRIIFCLPEYRNHSAGEQVEQSIFTVQLLLSLVKALDLIKKLHDTPITLVSYNLFSDENNESDFSMLYPYAIRDNICCEFGDSDISMIDIDSTHESLQWVINHIECSFRKSIIVRHGKPYVQSLGPVYIGNEKYPVSPDGCYVVFGGTGGIGSTLVQLLSEKGATHIIIAQRTSPNIDTLRQKTTVYGCKLESVTCNVLSHNDVSALFCDIASRNIQVKGIAHCAGAAGKKLLRNVDEIKSQDIISPKIDGLLNIESAIKQYLCCQNLEFLLLCSSAMSLIGVPGQAQYVVGNTFMDLYATKLRRCGIPACVVDWTAWNDIGMAHINEFDKRDELLESISSSEAKELLSLLLHAKEPRVVVGKIQYSLVNDSILNSLTFELGIERKLSYEHKQANHTIRTVRKPVTITSKEDIERVLLSIVADVTGLIDLNVNDNITEMGGDSIALTKIHEEIDAVFPGAILISQMFVYPSVRKLSEYLTEQLHISTESESSANPNTCTETEDISIEDAIVLLEKYKSQTVGDK